MRRSNDKHDFTRDGAGDTDWIGLATAATSTQARPSPAERSLQPRSRAPARSLAPARSNASSGTEGSAAGILCPASRARTQPHHRNTTLPRRQPRRRCPRPETPAQTARCAARTRHAFAKRGLSASCDACARCATSTPSYVKAWPCSTAFFVPYRLTGALIPDRRRRVQYFTHLARQGLGCEWLLQKCHLALQDAVADHAVVGVAGHVKDL